MAKTARADRAEMIGLREGPLFVRLSAPLVLRLTDVGAFYARAGGA